MPKPPLPTSPARVHAVMLDALLTSARVVAPEDWPAFVQMVDDAVEHFQQKDGAAPSWLAEAQEVLRTGDRKKQSRDEFLAETVPEMLPRGLSPKQFRKAVRSYLDTLAAVHTEHGIEVPAWIIRARQIHLGEGQGN